MSQSLSNVLRDIKYYVLKWIKNAPAGVKGGNVFNKIVVYHRSGANAEFFEVSDAGMALANAAAQAWDTIESPPAIYSNPYTFTNVTVIGHSTYGTEFQGQITAGGSGYFRDFHVNRSASDGSDLVGILGPASGSLSLNTIQITTDQSGAGNSYALQMQAGAVNVRGCAFSGTSAGGAGYGVLGGGGDCKIEEGSTITGSTADISGSGIYVWNFDKIIRLLHANGTDTSLYPRTAAGLSAANSAAASGGIVKLPAGTISGAGLTLADNVEFVGEGRGKTIVSGAVTVGTGTFIHDLGFSGSVTAEHLCRIRDVDIVGTTSPVLTLAGTELDSPSLTNCLVSTNDQTDGQYAYINTGWTFVDRCTITSYTGCANIDSVRALHHACRFRSAKNITVNLGSGLLHNCLIDNRSSFGDGHGLAFTQAGKTALVTHTYMDTESGDGYYGLYVTEAGLTLVDSSWDKADGLENVTYGEGDRASRIHEHVLDEQVAAPGGTLNLIAGSVTVTDDAQHNGFPGLAEAPDGTLLLVYRKATNHAASKGTIVKKTSTDGGASWSGESTIVNDATYDAREPSLTKLAGGDVLLMSTLYDQVGAWFLSGDRAYVRRSTDNGATWGAAVAVTSSFTDFSYASARVVELTNGDLLLPLYGADTGDTYHSARVSRSTDDGATWAHLANIGNGEADSRYYAEPNILRLQNGNLLCLMRSDTPNAASGQFYASWSGDEGATWSDPLDVLYPEAVFDATGRPNLIQLSNGMVVCIYRDRSDSQAYYRLSRTNGESWEAAVSVWSTSAVQMSYAAMVEYEYGLVGVAIGDEDAADDSNIIFLRLYTTLEAGQLVANVPDGTAPLAVESTTLVTNLNADLLDGHHLTDIELPDLADVDDALAPGAGDVLAYDGAKWTARNPNTLLDRAWGSMYQDDTGTTIAVAATDTDYIVDGMSQGILGNMTFDNGQELVIEIEGIYKVDWSLSFDTSSANQEIEGAVGVNGVRDPSTSAHAFIGTANNTTQFGGTGLLSLVAGDLVQIVVRNETSTADVIVAHANLSLVFLGLTTGGNLLLETGDALLLETDDNLLLEE